jgi:hypothetical protein
LELAEGGQATFSAAHEDRKYDSTLRFGERKPRGGDFNRIGCAAVAEPPVASPEDYNVTSELLKARNGSVERQFLIEMRLIYELWTL